MANYEKLMSFSTPENYEPPHQLSAFDIQELCVQNAKNYLGEGGQLYVPPIDLLHFYGTYTEQSRITLDTLKHLSRDLTEMLPGVTETHTDRDRLISLEGLKNDSGPLIFVGKDNLHINKHPVEKYFLGVLCEYIINKRFPSAMLVSYFLPPVDDPTTYLTPGLSGYSTIEKIYLPPSLSIDPDQEIVSRRKFDRRERAKLPVGATATAASISLGVVLVRMYHKKHS